MRAVTQVSFPPTCVISEGVVANALSYVHESEIRVRSLSVNANEFIASLECRSPNYTTKPVEYISTSELAVSSAQVGQVVLHVLVDSPSFAYRHLLTPERLSDLRENHQVYFLNWQVRFRRVSKREDYEMSLTVERVFTKMSAIFTQCSFRVGTAIEGSFTALIPGEEHGGAK